MKRVSTYIPGLTPAIDTQFRLQTIGLDIEPSQWVQGAEYRVATATDGLIDSLSAVNTTAWSLGPTVIGWRKILQIGGGGDVWWLLKDPTTLMSRYCSIIDRVILSDGLEHAVPDAIVCLKSVANPVNEVLCPITCTGTDQTVAQQYYNSKNSTYEMIVPASYTKPAYNQCRLTYSRRVKATGGTATSETKTFTYAVTSPCPVSIVSMA
jgi:hypothetical protein